MLVFRASHRAARLAESLSPTLRSLHLTARIASRQINVATLQRFSLEFNSRSNAGYSGVFSVRHFSSSQTDENAREEEKEKLQRGAADLEGDQVYQAPMSRAVRLMKAVSVTSCTLTSIGMPMLCMLSEQDASTIGKWAMCGTIMLFGFGTTSLFHYLFKPYVMRMWLADSSTDASSASAAGDADPTVTVESVTLFAQLEKNSFRLSEVSPPTQAMHPMVSFQAHDRHYFIHPEAFEDQDLLKKLVGAGKRK
ncbi:hypothetical protein PF005_g4438 [Phytophthora fragariae]|uniref:Transmembrane protein 70 n=1 Tax=Phytophthora fragariae TaxID=53985 RepID=A0A6A3FVK0_9STRA|nr:hypothetical protein PF003_g5334 [Phytophthora fragariae]KAE8945688.1 hypothetical protein PF009_g4671 [Phytophthora fragariae]KAE9024356.1 hypothetical protein PF011_g3553 [Phytophthora fragariae]KAE9128726.1 hypothetical protein PF010_g4405 [Phytophthora fragariae]KAE9137951.1 hypothetical protein PF007_g1629 [Phytophthora fragariae]